jgi:hypothetical protein
METQFSCCAHTKPSRRFTFPIDIIISCSASPTQPARAHARTKASTRRDAATSSCEFLSLFGLSFSLCTPEEKSEKHLHKLGMVRRIGQRIGDASLGETVLFEFNERLIEWLREMIPSSRFVSQIKSRTVQSDQ